MLPSKLPDARIMSYCYDSIWIGDQAVRSSLEGVATKLLRSLGDERKVLETSCAGWLHWH